jgi:glutamyl-tRNA synthetase
VIRGEDHLSNTPKHLELFNALDVQPPAYAHIPLILNKDGSKMSKRDAGASIAGYVEGGFLPGAVRNYLSLLGWSPKDNREVLALDETVRLFDLAKVNRKNAHFDIEKCLWFNTQYLQKTSPAELRTLSLSFIEKAGIAVETPAALDPVLALVREKVKTLAEVPSWLGYFFTEDYPFDPQAVTKAFSTPPAFERLAALTLAWGAVESWDAAALELSLKQVAADLNSKPNELLLPTRVAVSGRGSGPNLFPMLEVLGRERTLSRLRHAHAIHSQLAQ